MPDRKSGRSGIPPTPAEKQIFNKRRFGWLDQVMADKESSAAARLAWYVSQDVARTFNSTGEEYSYRGQEAYAELLGIKVRQVRDQFNKLERRCHIMTKRRGKGNSNWTYLTLQDRQKTADQQSNDRQETAAQNDAITGIPPHDDRQSNDALTGNKLPGNLIKDITDDFRAGQKPAPKVTKRAASKVVKDSGPSRLDGGNTRPSGGASPPENEAPLNKKYHEDAGDREFTKEQIQQQEEEDWIQECAEREFEENPVYPHETAQRKSHAE